MRFSLINELFKLAVCYTVTLYHTRYRVPLLPYLHSTSSPILQVRSSQETAGSSRFPPGFRPAELTAVSCSLKPRLRGFSGHSQFKILPTAVLSILLLKTSLPARKWLALGLLMVGLAIIQSTHYDIENSTSLKGIQSKSLFSSSTGSIAKLWRFSSQSSVQAVCNIRRNTGR